MDRLFFVNRFFHPDQSATSQMLTDLALHLAVQGREVRVVCSRLGYENPAALYPRHEVFRGVRVRRLASTRFGRGHLAGRALDYLTFYAAVFWRLLLELRRGDVVVAKTDPPLLSVVVGVAARLRGARLVNWLQDVFPEVGAALGVGVLSGMPGRLLGGLRNLSLRGAAANVVLGERMAQHLRHCGAASEQIICIPNWADDAAITPLAHAENAWRERAGWAGRYVVAYSGNLGRAHEVPTLLAAMRLLKNDDGIFFAFIGGGARLETVRAFAAEHGLRNVCFLSYQPREVLRESLGAADLHLVSLLPGMEGLIVPSKIYGIAAAGRPMAFVGDPRGEVADLLGGIGPDACGAAFAPGDADGLADFIRRLASDPPHSRRMGENARKILDTRFSQQRSLAAWSALLEGLRLAPVLSKKAG